DFSPDLSGIPLAILNMCESAQITPLLSESFVDFFLDSGVRSVLGTECIMTVNFAHAFAQELLQRLFAGLTIGQALLETRRVFKDKLNPLGLAYTLFGSATLCFKPARFESS